MRRAYSTTLASSHGANRGWDSFDRQTERQTDTVYSVDGIHTPTMRMFMSWSMCVRLNVACPLFIISLVSLPAKMTRPKHHPVLRSTQPRSNSFSLSSANFSSLQFNTPSNLLRWLLGGSHTISPALRNTSTTLFSDADNAFFE